MCIRDSPPTASLDTSLSTSELLDFPLVLYDSAGSALDRRSGTARPSSAIVPFQKLQMDTNLNQTLLPYKQQQAQASGGGSGGSSPSSAAATATSSSPSRATSVFAWEAETSELMHALRLGDLRPQEPQLSVRLRGSRVELASASEDEDVDFMGPAENIKKLFKLPYSQARVSLAVHRVGSTLVVDGELRDSDLPAGFEDFPQETLTLQRADERTQSLLYEKFVYETAVQARLTVPPSGSNSSGAAVAVNGDSTGGSSARTPLLPASQPPRASSSKKQQKRAKKRAAGATGDGGGDVAAAPALTSDELHRADDATMGFTTPPRGSWMSAAASTVSEPSASTSNSSTGANHSAPAKSKRKKAAPDSASAPYSSPSDHRGETPYTQAFQRILKWKFHDLKMILGSQVLLFSDKDHPAVSLKLHDMDTDLSLCTVLDYYLDNVIANIPELAICMHSKGLVRGYKLVETRQIPYLSGSTRPLFDIQDVSLNASMLLKFLQENCSRPNGTYWLYRKAGENSLRLYDVDVLSQGKQLKWKYMMAMLCYRFASRASRLVHSLASDAPRLQRQLQTRQRELLRTCMQLLREIAQTGGAAHSSICASVSEQLADTYLRECEQTKSTDAAASETDSTDSARYASVSEDDDDPLRAMAASLEKAAEHLLESIQSFEECMAPDVSATSVSMSVSVPSPLPHEDGDGEAAATVPNFASGSDLQQDIGVGDDDGNGADDGDDNDNGDAMDSFMDDERERLQLKFSSVCVQLAQVHARRLRWDDAVAAVVRACAFLSLSAMPCDVAPLAASPARHDAIRALLERLDFDGIGVGGARAAAGSSGGPFICVRGRELRCRVLEVIGDMAAQLPTQLAPVLQRLYAATSGEQRGLLADVADPQRWAQWLDTHAHDAAGVSTDSATDACVRHEELLTLSFSAYLRALSPCVDSELYFLLMKKLGNASNELGKFFLGTRRDYVEAFRWFERGCKVFSEIEDGVNVALLCANLAHLHKLLAQGEATAPARQTHYEAAIALCRDALQQLRQNKAEAELHRKVKGELALTYLVWAVSMASDVLSDGTDVVTAGAASATASAMATARKQRENDVLKTFNRALSLYLELADDKQVASTHYQMASFHRRTIARDFAATTTTTTSSAKPAAAAALKSRLEIARRHYEKALAYFGRVEVAQTFVLIHAELADLHLLGGRIEDVEHALLLLLNTYDAFRNASATALAAARGGSTNGDGTNGTGIANGEPHDAMAPLANDVAAKVKLLLHQLIRMSAAGASGTSGSAPPAAVTSAKCKKLQVFKQMYREAIYYDGRQSASGSIEPMLATLRAMYLL